MSNKVETESELDILKKENLELKDRITQLNREIKAMKEEINYPSLKEGACSKLTSLSL